MLACRSAAMLSVMGRSQPKPRPKTFPTRPRLCGIARIGKGLHAFEDQRRFTVATLNARRRGSRRTGEARCRAEWTSHLLIVSSLPSQTAAPRVCTLRQHAWLHKVSGRPGWGVAMPSPTIGSQGRNLSRRPRVTTWLRSVRRARSPSGSPVVHEIDGRPTARPSARGCRQPSARAARRAGSCPIRSGGCRRQGGAREGAPRR